MAKKQVPSEGDQWWETPVEVPRAGLPSAKKLKNRTKWYRRLVWTSVIVMIPAMLSLFVLAAGAGDKQIAPVASGPPSTQPEALLAVKNWIAATPSPLPGGQVISWSSYKKAKLPTGRDAIADVDRLEVHTLIVSDANGLLYKTQVQLATGKSIGTVVVGQPSLIPMAPGAADATSSMTPWPTLEPTTASEGVETAITVWADAFTSGDPAKLLNAVGDTRNGVSYVPMAGVKFAATPTIDGVGALWGKDQNKNAQGASPKRVVVTVKFEGQWVGTAVGITNDLPVFTYDLLVDRADTASPRVVAWGGQGSGVWLKPYSNAVSGRVVAAPGAPSTTEEDPSMTGAPDAQVTTGEGGV